MSLGVFSPKNKIDFRNEVIGFTVQALVLEWRVQGHVHVQLQSGCTSETH